jgi:hypothetical protein
MCEWMHNIRGSKEHTMDTISEAEGKRQGWEGFEYDQSMF